LKKYEFNELLHAACLRIASGLGAATQIFNYTVFMSNTALFLGECLEKPIKVPNHWLGTLVSNQTKTTQNTSA